MIDEPEQNLMICVGCGVPMPAPDMADSILLEANYRKEHADEAFDPDKKRALICADCLAKLQAIHKEHSDADV